MMGVVISSLCWGQPREKDMYSFSLNGHKISPSPNFEQSIKAFRDRTPKGSEKQDDYVILQFYTIPSVEEKEQLERRGLKLLDYLHGNAYFSSVSPDFYRIKTREAVNIRSMAELKPEYKIDRKIASEDIPDYAKNEVGLIKAVVAYFELPGEPELNQAFKALNAIKIRTSEVFSQIYLEIPQEKVEELAALNWVQNIQLVSPPVEAENRVAATSHRAHLLHSNIRGLGYGLTGKGVKIGLWDDDVENHPDFEDRIVQREYESHGSSHGTHTCGTIIGAGILDSDARGMAPEATVYSWNFNTQSNGLTMSEERAISLEEDSIEITSNSYGYRIFSCPNYIEYDVADNNNDKLSYLYPYFLYVFSAGNSQTLCVDGYRTTTKNMKNALNVAAINREDDMSTFSSFGPSFDGRLIPNISGDGVAVYSTVFDNTYATYSGTSMATPGVAGTMALLYQRYKETHQGARPLSSLMRAIACNTAKDFGNPGPDYQFGYGLIDGLRAVEVLEKNTYFTDKVQQGTTATKKITVPKGAVGIKIMLAWTDPAAIPGNSKVLINDLELRVLSGSCEVLPWVLDPENPSNVAVRGIDNMNNMEQVTIENPVPGSYTIQVSGKSIPSGVQDFAIVYDVVMPDLTITYPLDGAKFIPGTEEVIRWESEGNTAPFTLEYSVDNGLNYTVVGTDIPAIKRSFVWSVPEGANLTTAKFRISSAAAMDEMKGTFIIMSAPQNVEIEQHFCTTSGPFAMTWDSVPNSRYEVLKFNGREFEPIALTEDNYYEISDLKYGDNNYFCVRAIDRTSGIIGERSEAKYVEISLPVKSLPFVEKFNTEKVPNVYIHKADNYSSAAIQYQPEVEGYSIFMQGANYKDARKWRRAKGAECFVKNSKFVEKAVICNLAPGAYEGNKIFLKFDMKLFYSSYFPRNTSLFRVKANDDYLTDSEGTEIFGDAGIENYKTVYYDLSAYAGKPVSVELESVCRRQKGYRGDCIYIDNLEIFEAEGTDISLEALSVSRCSTPIDTIFATVLNLSQEDVSNIPISYQVNGGKWVHDTVPGPVAPMEHARFPFNQVADFSKEARYDIHAKVSKPNDTKTGNNEQTLTVYHDESVRIGTRPGRRVDTCAGLFTDLGGQFQNYPLDESNFTFMTIAPDEPNKAIKVNFTEFAMVEDIDYLVVFDGPRPSSPEIARVTGNSLPPSFTSTALKGELSFRTRLTNYLSKENDKGWIASIECVSKPVTDILLADIVKPEAKESVKTDKERISFLVRNAGLDTVRAFDAYFRFNNGEPVRQSFITNLRPDRTAVFTFDSLMDLSKPGTYKILVGIELEGDELSKNNIDSIEVVSIKQVTDMEIAFQESVKPAREKLSEIKVKVSNRSNFSVDNYKVGYTLNGVIQDTIIVTEALRPEKSKVITFEKKVDLRAPDSENSLEIFVNLDGDDNLENNSRKSTVTTHPLATKNVVANIGQNNALITAGDFAEYDLINNYTIECWVYAEPNPRTGYIFQKGSVTMALYDNRKEIIVSINKRRGRYGFNTLDAMEMNTWHHIALTVSKDDEYTLYVDGEPETIYVYEGTPGPAKSNKEISAIMGNGDRKRTPLIGKMDELRVWDTCLGQQAIKDNMMTDYEAEIPGMVAYYKFNEGGGKYIYDYSVNDNTAEVTDADVSGVGKGKFWNTPKMAISHYSIAGEKIPAVFDEQTKTFNCIMDNADLTSLTAIFKADQGSAVKIGDAVQQSGVTINNYANGPIEYTVEGVGFNSGLSDTYKVEAANDLSSACDLSQVTVEWEDNKHLPFAGFCLHKNGDNFIRKFHGPAHFMTNLKGRYKASNKASVLIDGEKQAVPPVTARDYTKPFMVNVLAENQRDFKNYKVFIDTRSNRAELLKFVFPELPYTAYHFSTKEKKVTVWVNKAVDIARLRPVFKVSKNAKVYIGSIQRYSGMSVEDFTTPKVYTIVSEDETKTAEWTVSVLPDSEIPFLSLLGGKVITICKGSLFNDPGVIAKDNVDGDISSCVLKKGSVNTSIPGSYKLEYSVTDASGNVAKPLVRTVNVVENTLRNRRITETRARVYSYDGVVYAHIPELRGVGRITITDILGKVVYHKEDLGQGTTRLEAEFMPGVYVAVMEANGKVSSENIVIE